MPDNILSEPTKKSIVLADGKEYKFPPLNLTTIANLEETFEGEWQDLQKVGAEGEPVKKAATRIRKFLYALLKENYPELTLEQVGQLITLEKLPELTKKVGEAYAVLVNFNKE